MKGLAVIVKDHMSRAWIMTPPDRRQRNLTHASLSVLLRQCKDNVFTRGDSDDLYDLHQSDFGLFDLCNNNRDSTYHEIGVCTYTPSSQSPCNTTAVAELDAV